MSTTASTFEVIVGNIGTVYSGPDAIEAENHYAEYIDQSKSGVGRAGGEEVYMMIDNEIDREYRPIVATCDKLAAMMRENTGASLCDSGGAYGRHHERNQAVVSFDDRPEGSIEFRKWGDDQLEILATVDVYHFLLERLSYNPRLDHLFGIYCEETDEYGLQAAQGFVDTLDDPRGIYGDGDPITVNTYNSEDLLSQTIQYVYWTDANGAHVLLQIHGGCDVRGGYTTPVVFDVDDYDGTALFDNARGSIHCSDCDACYDTDDGSHWYAVDGTDANTDLHDCKAVDEKPEYPVARGDELVDTGERTAIDTGIVWVDADGDAHCPCCGEKLDFAPWPAG
jgi:hypothetical protein